MKKSSISIRTVASKHCIKQYQVCQSRTHSRIWGWGRNPLQPLKSQWCWIAPGVLLWAVHLGWCATIGPDLSTLFISNMATERKAIRDPRKPNGRLGSAKAGHSQGSPKTAKCQSQCEHTPLQWQNQWGFMRHQSPRQRPACLLLRWTIWMWDFDIRHFPKIAGEGFLGFCWPIPNGLSHSLKDPFICRVVKLGTFSFLVTKGHWFFNVLWNDKRM